MHVAIPLFEGVEEMDFAAPFEVFSAAAKLGANVETILVGLQESIRCAHGLRVCDLAPLDAADESDLVVVPGGGWLGTHTGGVRGAIADGRISALLARAHHRGAIVASVCTGAFLLAEAGLLDEQPATTHHSAIDDLRARGARIVSARVVDADRIVTAGGVTSGLDLALHLVGRFLGPEMARSVESYLEYEIRGPIHRE